MQKRKVGMKKCTHFVNCKEISINIKKNCSAYLCNIHNRKKNLTLRSYKRSSPGELFSANCAEKPAPPAQTQRAALTHKTFLGLHRDASSIRPLSAGRSFTVFQRRCKVGKTIRQRRARAFMSMQIFRIRNLRLWKYKRVFKAICATAGVLLCMCVCLDEYEERVYWLKARMKLWNIYLDESV